MKRFLIAMLIALSHTVSAVAQDDAACGADLSLSIGDWSILSCELVPSLSSGRTKLEPADDGQLIVIRFEEVPDPDVLDSVVVQNQSGDSVMQTSIRQNFGPISGTQASPSINAIDIRAVDDAGEVVAGQARRIWRYVASVSDKGEPMFISLPGVSERVTVH